MKGFQFDSLSFFADGIYENQYKYEWIKVNSHAKGKQTRVSFAVYLRGISLMDFLTPNCGHEWNANEKSVTQWMNLSSFNIFLEFNFIFLFTLNK